MSERRRLLAMSGLAVGTLSCFGFLVVCPHRESCLRAVLELNSWTAMGIRVAVLLAAATLAVWVLRVAWLAIGARVSLRRLKRVPVPARLAAAVARTSADPVICIDDPAATAFCVGALRPVIVVSEGLVERLGDQEIDAVLLHEQDHVMRHEPLVRAVLEAGAQVIFFVPLFRWYSRWRMEEAELWADRAALDRLGPRPVAAALWAVGSASASHATAAFADVAQLRAAQLLGETIPRRAPALALIASSLLGSYLALTATGCVAETALRLLPTFPAR